MRLGIALPVEIPGTSGETLIEWMRRIDDSPFETVAVVDEIVSDCYEGMAMLAAAAAMTRHVRLMSVVIAGPTRPAGLLAKQAASIDALSGGRLSLGLGVGELEDDFTAVGAELRGRGRRFDEQLAQMKRIWAGEYVGSSGRTMGPSPARPGGPELLIGGWAPRALERVGKFGDGYVGAIVAPEMITDEHYRMALDSWREHQRPGKPRFVQNIYFALGHEAREKFDAYLEVAYAGAEGYQIEAMIAASPTSAPDIREMVQRIESIGVDELIFHPVSSSIDQLDRLAQVIA